jgi:hypothetical protein
VCTRKPRTLQDLRLRIETASVAVPPAILQEVCTLLHVTVNSALGLVVYILNICEFKVTNEIVGYHL